LGDTARALIAFGVGAMTLAILAVLLLRQDRPTAARAAPSVPASEWAGDDDAPSFKDRLARIKLPAFVVPKMPWTKSEQDITELADLPKLRNGDSHPDAPPRRPLFASLDLPASDMVDVQEILAEPEADAPAAAAIEDAVTADAVAIPDVSHEIAVEPRAVVDVEPTLAEMVAQLEAAVAERQRQLTELEAVANELAASRPAVQPVTAEEQTPPEAEIVDESEIVVEPPRYERPPLEAVPSVSVKDDDMDSALAAAIATLHRMNAAGR
jgi:uncharacterized coiled-coil protein SlyX